MLWSTWECTYLLETMILILLELKWHLLPIVRSRNLSTSDHCILVLESPWKNTAVKHCMEKMLYSHGEETQQGQWAGKRSGRNLEQPCLWTLLTWGCSKVLSYGGKNGTLVFIHSWLIHAFILRASAWLYSPARPSVLALGPVPT